MMVSELTGAQLDYWTARAEGVPAEQLEIRRVPRTDWLHVVRTVPVLAVGDPRPRHVGAEVLRYSTDWAQGGPLVDKHRVNIRSFAREVECDLDYGAGISTGYAPAALEAICRAVVLAAFGDDVDEVPIAQA